MDLTASNVSLYLDTCTSCIF
uniref:Uncharacterized protein n=1 Tax=Rhizophora mucronata TaxID=61149 RepID=A0A2P2PKF6_RHIMU